MVVAESANITHECKQGVLTIAVTIPEDVASTSTAETCDGAAILVMASFESSETGAIYRRAYTAADLTAAHPIFMGMPELIGDFMAETPMITCTPDHVMAHWSVRYGKRSIEFDLTLAKKMVSIDSSQNDVMLIELQGENRVLRKRIIKLEERVELCLQMIEEQRQHISVLAEIEYPQKAVYKWPLSGGDADDLLSKMIVNFNINHQNISGDLLSHQSYDAIKRIVDKGFNPNIIKDCDKNGGRPLMFKVITEYRLAGCNPEKAKEYMDASIDFIEYLITHGYDVRISHNGETLLHAAEGLTGNDGVFKLQWDAIFPSYRKKVIKLLTNAGAK